MASSNFKVRKISIKNFDFTVGLSQMDYYEDVLSPTVIFDLLIVDTDGMFTKLPIVGSESASIVIEQSIDGETEVLEYSEENQNELAVFSSSVLPGSKGQVFKVRLMSKEMLKNETSRVVKKYMGSIESIVRTILRQDNQLISTRKNINVGTVTNSYSFIGAMRRPFDVITWLCPKTETRDDVGFLFFENKKGYNFVGVDETLSRESEVTLYQSNVPISPLSSDYYFTFSDIQINERTDLLQVLRMGALSHISIFLDMNNLNYNVINVSSQSELTDLNNSPSRLMFRVLDGGVMEPDGKQLEPEKLARNQASAYLRYNLLFTNSMKVTIPYNLKIYAGQIVECKISTPVEFRGDSDYDESISGKYMVSKVRHTIQGDNNFSVLELVRDAYDITAT